MGYTFSDKIVTPHQLCYYNVFEKYFPEWGLYDDSKQDKWKIVHGEIGTGGKRGSGLNMVGWKMMRKFMI